MFENLSDKLQRTFKDLRGQGTLTDENITDALRQIRVALLESDVNLNVTRELIEAIRAKALGSEVATALNPSEQIVKIVRDELMAVLGFDTARFKFAPQPPTVILMAGLQGSGKTTTSGKLAAVAEKGRPPAYVGLGRRLPPRRSRAAESRGQERSALSSMKASSTPETIRQYCRTVLRLAKEALREARNFACDILIVDTAGRLGIDETLMDEMAQLKKDLLAPSEILFVADAMTGQDAVNSAKAFNDRLQITGSILTKMDGDSRGGAALSASARSPVSPHQVPRHRREARRLRGLPPRPHRRPHFGHGRHCDAARARRRKARQDPRPKPSRRRLFGGEGFSLEDFRDQLRQIKKLGSMQSDPQDAALGRPLPGPAAGRGQRRRKAVRPR